MIEPFSIFYIFLPKTLEAARCVVCLRNTQRIEDLEWDSKITEPTDYMEGGRMCTVSRADSKVCIFFKKKWPLVTSARFH